MGSIPSPVMARLEQNWSRAVQRRCSHILKREAVDTLTVSGRCSTDKLGLLDQGQHAPSEGTDAPKPLRGYTLL